MVFILNNNNSSYTIPWALTDLFLWICWNRLFSRSSFYIGSQSRTFGTVWQHRHVLPLITDEFSLLVNCRVKLTGTSQEDCAGSTTLALKLGGSAPSSGPFRLAACVIGTETKILCGQHDSCKKLLSYKHIPKKLQFFRYIWLMKGAKKSLDLSTY